MRAYGLGGLLVKPTIRTRSSLFSPCGFRGFTKASPGFKALLNIYLVIECGSLLTSRGDVGVFELYLGGSVGVQVSYSARDNPAVQDGRSAINYFPVLNIRGTLLYVTEYLPHLNISGNRATFPMIPFSTFFFPALLRPLLPRNCRLSRILLCLDLRFPEITRDALARCEAVPVIPSSSTSSRPKPSVVCL